MNVLEKDEEESRPQEGDVTQSPRTGKFYVSTFHPRFHVRPKDPIAGVVVAGTDTDNNVAEAERRAAAARAQLAQIEQARRAAAEELRASQNIVEDARRRAARDQQRWHRRAAVIP